MNDANHQLSVAITLAATRFDGIFDKGGKPYILHCLKVMHYLQTADAELQTIAVLHDIIEDTNTTYEELRKLGFSERVIEGVRCMTKLPGQTDEEYFQQVAGNPDTVKVKKCDLRHNSDIRRLKGVSDKDIKRIVKYQNMYQRLNEISPCGNT